MYRSGKTALAAFRDLSAAPARRRRAAAAGVGGHQFDLENPEINFGPGDWFVNLGAPWTSPYDSEFLAGLRARGCGFAMLAHDLIPELFPEWCTETMVEEYDTWLNEIVPQADLMFAVSRHTAADLVRCLTQKGKTGPAPEVLPIGSCLAEVAAGSAILETPYVLMVGTIEARKNHGAMMRVWRRLLETMPREQVPDLVFAGKVGWLTTDLIQQLTNANWFGGKIRFIDSPSETLLANLYQHCAFTVFPSLYEGWGLPVTESLCFGKTVVASNRAAIPEAGGTLCTYFDPDNAHDAYEIIRGMIEHPERVAALEARIAAEFRCPNWDTTAAAVLSRLGIAQPAAERIGVQSIG
jgi:glycosyltransferase involved in cell wall biosynthesis